MKSRHVAVGLMLIDLVLTVVNVGFLGLQELNPLMMLMFAIGGVWMFIIAKVLLTLYINKGMMEEESKGKSWLTNFVIIVYSIIFLSNAVSTIRWGVAR